MATLTVTKMHALGNDFLVLDWVQMDQALSPDLIRMMCDRRFGLGADQCLCLCPLDGHPVAHFGYRIFNADGQEVEQCGNGVRALAYFVHQYYDAQVDPLCLLSTTSRQWQVWKEGEGQYAADLGEVVFQDAIEVQWPNQDQTYTCHLASVGNPHAVCWVEQTPDQYPLDAWGAWLQEHPSFPKGVNLGLVQRIDAQNVVARVYERGVGETLACGSHACAIGAIGIREGLLTSPVVVQMPGGFLQVAWQPEGDKGVCLSGSVTQVFRGEYFVPEHLLHQAS